jgi:hypothetical protein
MRRRKVRLLPKKRKRKKEKEKNPRERGALHQKTPVVR